MQKRALAIHDISCFGKCSLTVALPILSACGVECAVLPTAILSTHTGGFAGYTYRDLTGDLLPVFNHWDALGLTFDAVYSGYLGSYEQLDIVAEIFNRTRAANPGALIVADPVMADEGKLYASFSPDFPAGMRELCRGADIIVPNMTEAALMLGEEYNPGPYAPEYIEGLLRRLSGIPRRLAVVTGVYFGAGSDTLGAACMDVATGRVDYAMSERVPGMYHGSGDVFGSALTGALLRGKTPRAAMQVAADFTSAAVKRSLESGADTRYGLNFEEGLGDLALI